MSQPSLVDVLTPFDPTGYTSISGAQLEQFGSGIIPFTDKGIVVVSTDIAGVAQVPNANTNPKWQNYVWIRQSATTVSVYVWGTNVASDAVFLQWVSVNVAGIGVGSITGAQIASNTITPLNISSVNFSQIAGFPGNLPPSGAAGGVLAGTYPNPSIAANAVLGSMIGLGSNNNAITGTNINPASVPVSCITPNGLALTFLRTNAGATAVEWFAGATTLVGSSALETNIATGANLPIKVNAAGNGYVYGPHDLLQEILYFSTSVFSTATNLAVTGTAPTTSNMALATNMGAAGSMVITPKSATSALIFDVDLQISTSTSSQVSLVLFEGSTPLAAGFLAMNGTVNSLCFKANIASTGTTLRTFTLYIAGSGGTTQINQTGSTALLGGSLSSSSVTIREYL